MALGTPVEPTTAPPRATARITGVDLARGLALFGMVATHVYDTFGDDGSTPTAATVLAGGRSAATFALVAGIGVAFLTGGRRVVRGRARTAAAAGLAVRAAVIGTIGLLLGFVGSGITLILPYYAVVFLLAIPLLRLSPRTLGVLAATSMVLAPLVLVGTARLGLDYDTPGNPTLTTVLTDPLGLAVELFLTGPYPVVAYMTYLCAGLAIGRLDLTSRRVAGRLLGGGLALAVTAKAVSLFLLYPLGGLDRLAATGGPDGEPVRVASLLWAPAQGTSWWQLALSSQHSEMPLDLAHTLGSAMTVLGAALLATRSPAIRRWTGPLVAAGTMSLTLYSAHFIVLQTEVLETDAVELGLTAQYAVLVVACLVFAVRWRRRHEHGPLEHVVAALSGRARRAVLAPATVPVRTGVRG